MSPASRSGLVLGTDGRWRCSWAAAAEDLRGYHDEEWGFPATDDRRLFEKICLEGFQSGLSWLTILRKRPAFRRAFAGFDFARVARFGPREVRRLLGDAGIVRHRGKIEAVVANARRARDLAAEHGSLAAYFWRFEPDARGLRATRSALARRGIPREAAALAADLKRRGWSFVGPTTVHAFMQAMGLVNDHLEGCAVRAAAEASRRALRRPAPAARVARSRGSHPR